MVLVKTRRVKSARATLLRFTLFILHFALFILHSLSANAESVRVVDCERDPKLDFWAKADNDFCTAVMSDVFKTAGVETVRLEFGKDHMMDAATADVICSAFRTQKLLQDFDFPVQPLGRMHFALYATPSRAMELMMRKDRRLAEIPVVAVTADVDIGSSYDMSLFAKVISKPVTAAKLKALFGIE